MQRGVRMNQYKSIILFVAISIPLLTMYNNCGSGEGLAKNMHGELEGLHFSPEKDSEEGVVILDGNAAEVYGEVALTDRDGDGFGDPGSVYVQGDGSFARLSDGDEVRAQNCSISVNDLSIISLGNDVSEEQCIVRYRNIETELNMKLCAAQGGEFDNAELTVLYQNVAISGLSSVVDCDPAIDPPDDRF